MENISRRSTLKGLSAMGALAYLGSKTGKAFAADDGTRLSDVRKAIFEKVARTVFIDTHEHLFEEKVRLNPAAEQIIKSDDWTLVLRHYIDSDMLSAGMSQADYDKFYLSGIDPVDKWKFLEPYWPAIKNTGYGQAVAITLKELYGVSELNGKTVRKVQQGYEKIRRAGFYKYILRDLANIESCQVNAKEGPFRKSDMPTLLMQDISILGMYSGPNLEWFEKPTGIKVETLADWHKVTQWWFDKYGKYATAAKSQHAYWRDIDYEVVPADRVETIFKKKIAGQSVTPAEVKMLQDHLFWYAVKQATEKNLPIKLHTGYYAQWPGQEQLPLHRIIRNPGSACDLCRTAPDARFVFMHICYPYYEELISVAKQYSNAYVDMCWAWLINPVASKDFLKKFLVTAPANKILTFGGDYHAVEPVLGHAIMARRGIALALSELVEEGWFSLDDALALTDLIMHENARKIFKLAQKEQLLKNVKWS